MREALICCEIAEGSTAVVSWRSDRIKDLIHFFSSSNNDIHNKDFKGIYLQISCTRIRHHGRREDTMAK